MGALFLTLEYIDVEHLRVCKTKKARPNDQAFSGTDPEYSGNPRPSRVTLDKHSSFFFH